MPKKKYQKSLPRLKDLPAQAQKALMSGKTARHAIVRAHISDDFWGMATLAELWYTDMPMVWAIYYEGPDEPELMGFTTGPDAWQAWQLIAGEYARFILGEPAPNPVGPE